MKKKNNFILCDYDLQNIIIMAVRYALGRKTYVTDEVPEFILKNIDVIDERMCIVLLRDLGRYFEDKNVGLINDDKCDYDSWKMLQNKLFKLANDKGFNIVGYERR